MDGCSHCIVDNHAAYGSFTVQAAFVPRTEDVGDYIFVKGIANERGRPYSCMEAIIEAWWNAANFGLVYLLNRAGEFMIGRGQPIAQMHLYHAAPSEIVLAGPHPEHTAWLERRTRLNYRSDHGLICGVRCKRAEHKRTYVADGSRWMVWNS